MRASLACTAALLVGPWGIAHILPAKQVVSGFEPLSPDNRRVLVQEWLVEAITMWTIAALVASTTAVDAGTEVTRWVHRVTAGTLLVIAAVTGATGAGTPVVRFKIRVGLLTLSAGLLIGASFT